MTHLDVIEYNRKREAGELKDPQPNADMQKLFAKSLGAKVRPMPAACWVEFDPYNILDHTFYALSKTHKFVITQPYYTECGDITCPDGWEIFLYSKGLSWWYCGSTVLIVFSKKR